MSLEEDENPVGFCVREPQGDAEWRAMYALRWRTLRQPWGQPEGSERDGQELVAIHRVAVDKDGGVIAAGRLHGQSAGEGQVRYMAVAAAWRGRGVGSAILKALEAESRRRGIGRITLNARVDVAGFYRRLGYTEMGPGPLLFDRIEHVVMMKDLGGGKLG